MATSLTVPEVKRQVSAEDRKLYRLWQCLPDHPVNEDTAFEAFEQEAGRPGDNAWASAMLTSVKVLGIVTESNGMFKRASSFPELLPDHANRHGTDLHNERIEEQQAEERRKRAVADREAQRQYQDGPEMRERRELIALIREVVGEEVDVDRITVVEARVRRLEGIGATHIAA